jgi:hypothetical protein
MCAMEVQKREIKEMKKIHSLLASKTSVPEDFLGEF